MARIRPNSEVPDWYAFKAKTDEKRADVYLYEAIGGWLGVGARDFVEQLNGLDVDHINLYVNSPGGSVFDGMAIYNALRRHKAKVVATVDGLAASAASFIIQAADEVVMNRGSELMIHEASGVCIGNAGDMAGMAEALDKASESIAGIYAARSEATADEWRDAMRAESWYTAEEAVDAGLADVYADAAEHDAASNVAAFDLTVFAHTGRDDAPEPFIPRKTAAAAQAVAAFTPPAEPVESIKKKGADTMSDTLKKGIRERLGIAADTELSDTELIDALDEALAERAEDPPATASLPEGTVLIDKTEHERLINAATEYGQLRQQNEAAERAEIVDQAVADGKIPPARREHWLAQLNEDPGAAETLNALAPGLIPTADVGHTGGVDEASDDDVLFSKLYPTKEG